MPLACSVATSASSSWPAQKLASARPCVLLGDFNLRPGDAGHALITRGRLEDSERGFPRPMEGYEWTACKNGAPNCVLPAPMRSAYAAAEGAEPSPAPPRTPLCAGPCVDAEST